jgi:hypothetical protein
MPTNIGQHDSVAQPKRTLNGGAGAKERKEKHPINWNEWWPFTRATGDALKQLNRRQTKQLEDYEEAPL